MNEIEFKKSVVPMGDRLFRIAFRMLGSQDDARDALQDVFVKLWRLKDTLHKYNSLEAFATTVTKNHCLDRLKAKKPVLMGEMHRLDSVNMGDNQKDVELVDKVQKVKTTIGKLPDLQRKVIEMRDVEGFSFEEIGGFLNMSVTTVRVNLSRARKRVRESLKKTFSYGIEAS